MFGKFTFLFLLYLVLSSSLNSISNVPNVFFPFPLTSPQNLLTALSVVGDSIILLSLVDKRISTKSGCWSAKARSISFIRSTLIFDQLGTISQVNRLCAVIARIEGVGAFINQSFTSCSEGLPYW